MSLYVVKKVQVSSILKVVSVVYAIVGALIGLFMFFFFPTDFITGLSFGVRLLSWVTLVVFYTVSMVVAKIIMAWLYNFVASKLNGGVVISLELKE